MSSSANSPEVLNRRSGEYRADGRVGEGSLADSRGRNLGAPAGFLRATAGGRRTVVEQSARVLVVEADDPVRTALEVALREDGYDVHAYVEAAAAQQLVDQFPPDLAILDVSLIAGADPYSAVRLLRATSNLPLIIVAAGSVPDRLTAADAAAGDYLVKPVSIAELLALVQTLLRRTKSSESAVRRIADVTIDDSARTVVRAGRRVDLTRTEYDLFAVLAKHPGQALSKAQLLTQAWGFDAYDVNLVEVHMSSLRRKLETHGPRLIHTVRGVGYLLRP